MMTTVRWLAGITVARVHIQTTLNGVLIAALFAALLMVSFPPTSRAARARP